MDKWVDVLVALLFTLVTWVVLLYVSFRQDDNGTVLAMVPLLVSAPITLVIAIITRALIARYRSHLQRAQLFRWIFFPVFVLSSSFAAFVLSTWVIYVGFS